MSIKKAANQLRAKAPADSRVGILYAIEQEAGRLAPDDMAKRFELRNQMRAAAGLEPEERKRGGLAGAHDKGFLLPAAALLAGPAALTLMGGGAGGAAGAVPAGTAGTAATTATAAGGAAGGLAPVPASGGVLDAIGGGLDKASDFLNSKTGQTLTGLASAGYGIAQQNKANKLTGQAVAADQARWKAGQPLRDAGMAGMLQPVPANTTATLGDVGRRGNPFAPVPAMGGR